MLIRHGKKVKNEVTIKPLGGWSKEDVSELWSYRELFWTFVMRDLKARYAQTIMGFGWALFQPLVQIITFTVIFGRVAKLPTDGVPYPLFVAAAILPWQYMSTVMGAAGLSLVNQQGMLGKIYFPRLLFPSTPILTGLVDFLISLFLLLALMIYFSTAPSITILFLPLFLAFMVILPFGIGLWLAALAIRYRDVRFAMGFVIRMLMYSAPVIYAASVVPDEYKAAYFWNPFAAVVEGFRASVLGLPIDLLVLAPGLGIALLILVSGAWYFRRMEHVFVDVI